MAYKNPVPVILDNYVSKKASITFTFEQYVTKEEAVNGINQLIKENGGEIPEQWVKLINPIDCVDMKELKEKQ